MWIPVDCISLICIVIATFSSPSVYAGRPNFLLILTDDSGWGDFGVNDPATTETKNIDLLAQSGLRFTDWHAAASVCTPSRAGLLTGRYGLRTGVTSNFGQFSIGGLSPGEHTIATVLGGAYDSHMIGKWHLGHHPGYHPTFHGFNTFYGLPYSGDMGCLDTKPYSCKPTANRAKGTPECPALCSEEVKLDVGVPLYDTPAPNCSTPSPSSFASDGDICDRSIVEQPVHEASLNYRYAQRASQIVAAHAAKRRNASSHSDAESVESVLPLFLYIGFAHTHTPLTYRSQFANYSTRPGWRQVYGNTLAELDSAVGNIVKALQRAGTINDTLIVLTSDNGPANLSIVDCDFIGSAGPFQAKWQARNGGGGTMKGTTWEGGHRVVGIASWPGRIAPGVTNALASSLDVLPTFAAAASVALPHDREYDGIDLSDLLFGNETVRKAAESSVAERVLFHPRGDGELIAMRFGKYKAFFSTDTTGKCNGGVAPERRTFVPPLVFDVEGDHGESTPVTLPPARLDAMVSAHQRIYESIRNTLRHSTNYSSGGWTAAGCCNRDSLKCRCKGQPPLLFV